MSPEERDLALVATVVDVSVIDAENGADVIVGLNPTQQVVVVDVGEAQDPARIRRGRKARRVMSVLKVRRVRPRRCLDRRGRPDQPDRKARHRRFQGQLVDRANRPDRTARCSLDGAWTAGADRPDWLDRTAGARPARLSSTGASVPTGGATGQVLTKRSGADFDTTWSPATGGVTSFNSRTGAVVMTSGDVTTALAYTPVNKAGDTMTGPLTTSGLIIDPTYYINVAAAGPEIAFDANDYLVYDRANNIYNFYIGSGLQAQIYSGTLNVPNVIATSQVSVGSDGGYYLNRVGGNPAINFDANDYMLYDRAGNAYSFLINGVSSLQINGSGITVPAVFMDPNYYHGVNTTGPFTVFDAGSDFIQYDRANNNLNTVIAGAQIVRVGPGGMLVTGAITSTAPSYQSGAAGTTRMIILQSSSSNRWGLSANQTAESGSNAGSDFTIDRYNDAGLFVDQPFQIRRSDGLATIAKLYTPPKTVAALPANPVDGQRDFVTDATTNTFENSPIGGGSFHVPVFYSGVGGKNSWRIG